MSAIPSVRSRCLDSLILAFRANLNRTVIFQMLPVEIATQGRRDAIFEANAGRLSSGNSFYSIGDVVTQRDSPIYRQTFADQVAELEEASRKNPALQNKLRVDLGVNYVNRLLDENPEMRESMDAIFASVIMDSWTAFECLSSDVWSEAVNKGPSILRSNVMGSKKLKTGKTLPKTPKPGARQPIDPAVDLAGSLIELGRVSFQSVWNIEEFFKIILDRSVFDKIFPSSPRGPVAALAAVRNAVAHKSGYSDQQFEDQTKSFPYLSCFKARQKIMLDGEIVARLRNAAIQTGSALLTAADDIITPP